MFKKYFRANYLKKLFGHFLVSYFTNQTRNKKQLGKQTEPTNLAAELTNLRKIDIVMNLTKPGKFCKFLKSQRIKIFNKEL